MGYHLLTCNPSFDLCCCQSDHLKVPSHLKTTWIYVCIGRTRLSTLEVYQGLPFSTDILRRLLHSHTMFKEWDYVHPKRFVYGLHVIFRFNGVELGCPIRISSFAYYQHIILEIVLPLYIINASLFNRHLKTVTAFLHNV